MVACRRIELLGDLRITGEPTTHFHSQKTAALLAFLAYHPDQAHFREALIEMLWPWADPMGGRHSLSQALSSLRRELEPPGIQPGSNVKV